MVSNLVFNDDSTVAGISNEWESGCDDHFIREAEIPTLPVTLIIFIE